MEKRKFIMLMVLGALFIIFCAGPTTIVHENNAVTNQMGDHLKLSGYWDSSQILIDDRGVEGLTWAEIAVEDWCVGSGTLEEPYIIENLTVTSNFVGDCLLIQNSDAYFIIRNCTFYNSGNTNSPAVEAGIKLSNVNNGKLINNTCYGNGNGIKLINCNYIIITENLIYDNIWWGIDFGWFHSSGNCNVISQNIVENNFAGISGASSGYQCTGNVISENKVNNNEHYGIILGEECYDNIVTRNNIANNGFGGIGASGLTLGGHENLAYLNFISQNYRNSKDLGVNNHWDNGTIGNYWSDYGGVDFDDNGIGDTPYSIPGSANAVDNYPIFEDGDDAPYSITINCTNVSNVIKIFGMDYIPQGESQTFELDEGFYSLFGGQVGIFAAFEVNSSGVVNYDVELEGSVLLGRGTSTITIVGHSITIDATDVDQSIALGYWSIAGTFLGWTEPGYNSTYNLVISGGYKYSLYTYFTHAFAYFDVLSTGVINYDNTQVGFIEGNETDVVKIIGHPITIDATDVDQDIAFEYWALTGSFMGWTKAGNTTTYRLVANGQYDYSLYTYFTHLFTYFRVLPTGAIYYDTTQLGVIKGNGTNIVRVIGHPITIDATDVDQDIAFEYWALTDSFMGWTKAGNTTTYRLVANGQYDYSLYTYFTHLFAYFRVLPTGAIYYDTTQMGIIEGNGTTTIKPIGYPITIDATEVDQHIGLGYWALTASFMGWTDPGTTRTYRLVANPNVSGGLAYRLYVANAHWFADFAVKPTGSLWYTEAFEGVVKGNNTSTITPIGHPITVDNTQTTLRAGVSHPGNPDLFLGYTEPGETRTYYLVANTQYPFSVYLENSGVGQFRVYSNKTCSPNEFPTVAGTIFIYYNYDDVPPVTEALLNGIEGNTGWYVSDVEITLSSEDLETGVNRTEYSYDGVNWIKYTEQIMITSEGFNEIYYRSIDNAGNVEDSKCIQISIDKSLPYSQIEITTYYDDSSGTIYVTSSTELNFSTYDEISGVAKLYYRINGGDWCVYEAPFSLDDSVDCYIIEYYCEDFAGNEEEFNSISVCLASLDFISYISRGESNPIGYFDVIFTFCKQTDEYKLVATNPGQLFYILEIVNNWPTSIESLDVEICLPADFYFKEGDAIQIFADGIDITSECLINGNLISVLNLLPGMNLKIVVHLDYALKGTYYPSLDEFGMKGYKFNSEILAIHGDPMILNNYLEESVVDSATLTTHQKKTTAIAGYVYNTNGMSLEGLTVELWMNGELISSTVTDENGFYYFIDIAEGEYEIYVYFGDSDEMQVATASKNELTEVNFELEYYPT